MPRGLEAGAKRRQPAKKYPIKLKLPGSRKYFSRKSRESCKRYSNKSTSGMSLTDLQFMARSRGIPFGGLTKNKLLRKINNY